jgi:hypothetical protein
MHRAQALAQAQTEQRKEKAMTQIESTAASLRQYAIDNPLNVLRLERPHPEHYRNLDVDGRLYRICFTYQVSDDIRGFILSVYNMDTPGAMPMESVCRSIADAIFPGAVYMDGDALNVNLMQISRKFIQFEALGGKAK